MTEGRIRDPRQRQAEAAAAFGRAIAGDDDARYMASFIAAINLAEVYRDENGAGSARRLGPEDGWDAYADSRDRMFSDPIYVANSDLLIRDSYLLIGATDTSDFPDCVAVGTDHDWCCSGTLIGPDLVLTAGHCAAAECATRVFFGEDALAGAGHEIAVSEVIPHPQYSEQTPRRDLAALRLTQQVDVTPRRIAGDDMPEGANSVRLVGFGRQDIRARGRYGRKQMVDVPISSPDDDYGCDPMTEFMAGAPFLDKDSCKGDSGGPAYVLVGEDWLLAGATSRGTQPSYLRPCGNGGIYTRVPRFREWIASLGGFVD